MNIISASSPRSLLVKFACVERTLLSAAFDLAFDFDFGLDPGFGFDLDLDPDLEAHPTLFPMLAPTVIPTTPSFPLPARHPEAVEPLATPAAPSEFPVQPHPCPQTRTAQPKKACAALSIYNYIISYCIG
jgi:hypothetical protein